MAKNQEDGITILLGLKGHKVGKVSEDTGEIMVEVKANPGGIRCPHCGSTRLYRHGLCQERKVLHGWRGGKRIYLKLHRHRWLCQGCNRSFNDGAELLRSYSRITRQAEAEVLWQLKERSFSQVRRELGVGYGTEGLRKAVEAVFPEARVVVDHFHVVADSNKRMDEARRIEQDVHRKRKVKIPKKIFLRGREKLSEEKKQRVDELLERYSSLKGFYWAKEKIRELYRQESREEATRTLDNIIFNLKLDDDGEMIRWGNTLKRWREPILNHFDNRTTNGFTEGCNTKIKMLKRISYGLRNVDVYWRKMLLGFVPSRGYFHTI